MNFRRTACIFSFLANRKLCTSGWIPPVNGDGHAATNPCGPIQHDDVLTHGWRYTDVMANVIDRLRVQGNPAPRNLPSQPQSGLRRLGRGGEDGEAELPPDVQFLLNHSHLQNRETNSG